MCLEAAHEFRYNLPLVISGKNLFSSPPDEPAEAVPAESLLAGDLPRRVESLPERVVRDAAVDVPQRLGSITKLGEGVP